VERKYITNSRIRNLNSQQNQNATLVAQDIQVKFRRGAHRYTSLKEFVLARLFRGRTAPSEFQALKGVKIELFPGEAVGLIGHNGSGKSTLLKVLCGVLRPAAGQVHYDGTLASLIELGAGFDGELSGRENILLNFALMGIAGKQAQDAVEGVLQFAEVQDFADEPVKNYSSGMQARLGFACATAFRPDILLVDEVLAVGDENFQRKCLAKMHEMKRAGTAIVLVSHDLLAIERFCDRAYVLDHGSSVFEGASAEAVSHFRSLLLAAENQKKAFVVSEQQSASSQISALSCKVFGEEQHLSVETGHAWTVEVTATGTGLESLTSGISIFESSTETHLCGLMAHEASLQNGLQDIRTQPGQRTWIFKFKGNPFHSGRYYIDVRLYAEKDQAVAAYAKRASSFDVVFQADPVNPHKNFIAMGALF